VGAWDLERKGEKTGENHDTSPVGRLISLKFSSVSPKHIWASAATHSPNTLQRSYMKRMRDCLMETNGWTSRDRLGSECLLFFQRMYATVRRALGGPLPCCTEGTGCLQFSYFHLTLCSIEQKFQTRAPELVCPSHNLPIPPYLMLCFRRCRDPSQAPPDEAFVLFWTILDCLVVWAGGWAGRGPTRGASGYAGGCIVGETEGRDGQSVQ